MTPMVAYYRVSTQKQGINGYGMDAQREVVARFIRSRQGELVGEYAEVESGKIRERPQLQAALEHVRKSKATLVIAKLDRLSRSASFMLALQEAGVDFRACDAPDVDRFTVGILALVAQRERELISERTRAGLRQAKLRGVRLGTRDPGARCRDMAKANAAGRAEHEAAMLPVVAGIRSAGAVTLAQIAQALNRLGYKTRHGKQWTAGTVWNLTKAVGKCNET